MHVTRGSTQSVTVLLPYTSANQYPSFGTDSFYAKACRWLAACRRTTERARSEFAILMAAQRKQETTPPVAQPKALPQDEHRADAHARAHGTTDTSEDAQLGPGHASPQAHRATAGAQRAAAGVSPGGRPVAPPGLGRLVTVVTPHR